MAMKTVSGDDANNENELSRNRMREINRELREEQKREKETEREPTLETFWRKV